MYNILAITRISCRFLAQDLATLQTQRFYTGRKHGFFSQFFDNLKNELAKNKEMKESIKKFREEAHKLEQSEALKSARKKFNMVESEAQKSTHIIKEHIESIKEKMSDALDEASKTDLGKKATKLTEELTKTAKEVSDTISVKSEKLGKTTAFQAIKQEIDDTQNLNTRVYRSPTKLRKRIEVEPKNYAAIEPNNNVTSMGLHKDSKFYQSWQDFKNNNAYVNKVLDWKIKYDESEHTLIRAARYVTDKISDAFGSIFSKTEISQTLTEICKLDPNFDQKQFLRDCETDIIPNILEAMLQGNLEILKDWCFEGTYNILATPIEEARKNGLFLDSKILDIENIDLVMGKVMEQGPILVITFQAQQIKCLRDRSTKKVVEGDPEKVLRIHYIWVLCRDPNEINPKAAWRLMELSANSREQFI